MLLGMGLAIAAPAGGAAERSGKPAREAPAVGREEGAAPVVAAAAESACCSDAPSRSRWWRGVGGGEGEEGVG